LPNGARFRGSSRGTAFAINLTGCSRLICSLQSRSLRGLAFLSAVALVWLERRGDRKLGKLAAIRAAA
jgi:hypothetical protein